LLFFFFFVILIGGIQVLRLKVGATGDAG